MNTPRDNDARCKKLIHGEDRLSSEQRVPERVPQFKKANLDRAGLRPTNPRIFQKDAETMAKLQLGKSEPRWNVHSGNTIPSFPLERPVEVNATPKVVAARIEKNMQKRSIQVEYDSEKARAVCVTSTFLKYHVTLFDGGDNVTSIEVQRRKGCPLEFRKERLATLNAAKDISTQSQSMPLLTIPQQLQDKYAPLSVEEITAMIKTDVGHLHAKSRESKLLSLHHLASMTDAAKANEDTAHKAAKIILESDIGVRNIITDYVVSGPQDETGMMMKSFGLTVLTNCFTLLEKDAVEELSGKDNVWFKESLFPSLIDDIKQCKSYHNAFLSSKVLCMLLKKSSIVRDIARDCDDLRNILENALLIGDKNHAKLHLEAQLTIRALECI